MEYCMYKISEQQLPTELQFYARGTGHFPDGQYTKLQIKSAIKYRQTFFRRLQAYRPGLQYQWPDYQRLMWQEIVAYAKRVLRKKVIERWHQLAGHNSRLGALYKAEKARLLHKSGPMTLARRKRLIQLAKENAFMCAIRDPRTLGILEEAIVGRAFYGIPDKINVAHYL